MSLLSILVESAGNDTKASMLLKMNTVRTTSQRLSKRDKQHDKARIIHKKGTVLKDIIVVDKANQEYESLYAGPAHK